MPGSHSRDGTPSRPEDVARVLTTVIDRIWTDCNEGPFPIVRGDVGEEGDDDEMEPRRRAPPPRGVVRFGFGIKIGDWSRSGSLLHNYNMCIHQLYNIISHP